MEGKYIYYNIKYIHHHLKLWIYGGQRGGGGPADHDEGGGGKSGQKQKRSMTRQNKSRKRKMKGNFFGINETYMAYIVYTVA